MEDYGTIVQVQDYDIAAANSLSCVIWCAIPDASLTYTLTATYEDDDGITRNLFANAKNLAVSSTSRMKKCEYALTQSEIRNFLTNIPTSRTKSIIYTLHTSGFTDTNSMTGTLYLSETPPAISEVEFEEVSGIEEYTGGNYYLKDKSQIQCSFIATPRTGAYINRIGVILNGRSYFENVSEGTSTLSLVFTPVDVGSIKPIVYARDSRGFSHFAEQTNAIEVRSYTEPVITEYEVGRAYPTNTTIHISFEATISSILDVTDVEQNTLTAKANVDGGSDIALTLTASASGLTFTCNQDMSGSYAENSVHSVVITLTDVVGGASTVEVQTPKAIPVMSMRDGMVGINKANPSVALDVNGKIMENGYGVLGVVNTNFSTTNFNYLTGTTGMGIYMSNSVTVSSNSAPLTNVYGVLEVIADGSRCLQKFYVTDDVNHSGLAPQVWIRTRRPVNGTSTWSAWVQII